MNKLAALLAIPLLVACAADSGSPGGSAPPRGSLEPTVPSQSPSSGGEGLPSRMLDEVIALAEEATGVDRSEIEVVLAEAVTWSDGSIGCPEEGMMYTQALVPGFRVVLDVAGVVVELLAGTDAEFFPCDRPTEPLEAGAPDR